MAMRSGPLRLTASTNDIDVRSWYDARMETPLWPKRFIIIGSALLLGASVLALFSMAVDTAAHLSSILIYAIPALFLAAAVGVVLAVIGTSRWAFDMPPGTLAAAGIVLIGISVLLFVFVYLIRSNFDDPSLVFASLIAFLPGITGVACLMFAASFPAS
jgi:hypothetical protein